MCILNMYIKSIECCICVVSNERWISVILNEIVSINFVIIIVVIVMTVIDVMDY